MKQRKKPFWNEWWPRLGHWPLKVTTSKPGAPRGAGWGWSQNYSKPHRAPWVYHHFPHFQLQFFLFLPTKFETSPSMIQYDRRKFRSQTSDNMERWKAEQGRGREKRKIRREKIRGERVRRQKIQMREKVGKSRNTVFFQWFVAPEGRKVGSLKRRVRSQLTTGMKNCTPLWREAHFQVKMYKAHQLRTTFGSWDVEKVHAVVARSTFRSQNAQNTTCSRHFWRFGCWKSARRCGAKHISNWKCTKHHMFAPLLEVRMLKSARRCGAKHISKSKCTKH